MELTDLIRYFLYLGATAFGGPVAAVSYMHRDLVERKKWFTQATYSEGLALVQMLPGPISTNLTAFFGWSSKGRLGAVASSMAFIFPSYLIVLVLGFLYTRFGHVDWIQGSLYGVNAAVVSLIAVSGYRLLKKTAGNESIRWMLSALGAIASMTVGARSIGVVLIAGVIYLLVKRPRSSLLSIEPVTGALLLQMFAYFFKMGAVVFGGGMVIVPFLEGGVVHEFGWLTPAQFLDSVAVGMITPGPIMMSVAFMGFLKAGFIGSLVCVLGIFLPAFLLVLLLAPRYSRIVKNPHVRNFVTGVSCAAVGMICGAVITLGRAALTDIPAALIAAAVLAILVSKLKVPDALILLSAGLAGYVVQSMTTFP